MDCNVLTIARTLGAGGEDLAKAVAAELGFLYMDSEILATAAAKAGVRPEIIAWTEVHSPSADWTFGAALRAQRARRGASVAAAGRPEPRHERAVVEAVREAAERRNVVIVGHGAAFALRGRPGVLTALVTASPAARATRIAIAEGITGKAARRRVDASDAARDDFFRRFYGVTCESAGDYDVIVNTDSLGLDAAKACLLGAVRSRTPYGV